MLLDDGPASLIARFRVTMLIARREAALGRWGRE